MGIQRIKRTNVGEQVLQQMKEMLISGEWKQGEKLPSENELAELFGISRITVRQALQKLNALGLLETRVGEGTFVKEVDLGSCLNELLPTMYLGEWDDKQVIEYRLIIETGSASLAAQRATGEDIRHLEELLSEMEEAAGRKDNRCFAEKDLEFHNEIALIARNPLLIKTNAILKDILAYAMRKVIDRMQYTGLSYHKKLIEAFRAHDEEAAQAVMREHIMQNEKYF